MQTVLAWVLIPVLVILAYPWAVWFVSRSPERGERELWLIWPLALALSTGSLTLVMFWLGLLGIPFMGTLITMLYLALMLPGWWLWWRTYRPLGVHLQLPQRLFPLTSALLLFLISIAILFNAAYWPFSRDDTLGIYHAQAVQFAERQGLIPLTGADSLYLTYPALMPLIYAYTYLISGWENEYLARVVPALLSLGCLPVTYALGRRLGGRLAGWLAALLLAFAPTFARWASEGYVDLPMAFFFALAALFALRLWDSRHWSDALLAGLLMGFAAWTKNAALIGVALLAAWLLWGLLRRRLSLRLAVPALTACAFVAGPWYARNLLGAGFLLPDTAWTDEARQTLDSLLIFVTKPDIFGLSGWVILAGLLAAGMRLVRRKGTAGDLLVLGWVAPFFAAWWLFASYDPRFLLLFLPMMAALGGVWLASVWRSTPHGWRVRLRPAALTVMVVMSAYILWISIEHKDAILSDPLMSSEAKHELVLAARGR